ncbi:MAG: T9SS type A sorting domain-containing protein [Bacteroidetes bacterium]|nr:T9SS type A sorting domain-containing protein [Bacteroidota bacterium]
MRKTAGIWMLILFVQIAKAQQLLHARNINLVSQPNTQLVTRGGISFTGTAAFTHKGTITLLAGPLTGTANWLDSTSGVMNTASAGKVELKGISVSQQVYGPTRFDSLTVQNTGTLFRQSNEIRQWLQLTNGLINFSTANDSIYVSNPAITAINYNTDSLAISSWINGKLSRRTNTTSGTYFFPVGKMLAADSLYAPVKFDKQNNAVATYSVQYFPAIPFDRSNKNPVIDHISSVEYWEITSHNFASSGDDDAVLSLSWRDYSLVNALAIIRDSLLVAHYYFDGANFQWQPEFNAALPNNVNGNVNFGYIKTNKIVGDFSMPHLRFSIGTRSTQNLLPLTLLDWNVTKQDQTALCKWVVTDDREVDMYQVERSPDGIHFTSIGIKPSLQRSGNSSYTFTDNAPLPGHNYYRLKATGNGLINFSGIRHLYFDVSTDWLIYPNPAKDIINIKLPVSLQPATITITDAAGHMIAQRTTTGALLQLNIAALSGGLYYVDYNVQGKRQVKSFIKN